MASNGKNSDGFDPARRKALRDVATYATGAACAGALLSGFALQSKKLQAEMLRPPGALPEKEFLAACVRCGLCVRDCPEFESYTGLGKTLKLAELGDGAAVGTPYFVARNVPCEMCEDIPCVKACPTGALLKDLVNIEDARMGFAVITSRETCLNLLGLRCDVCYRVCPLIDKAITLELSHNTRTQKHAIFEPMVHVDYCTGCGKCEKSCVLPEAAIKVLPHELANGQVGAHYRLGWKEKEKAGRELVPGVYKPDIRMPEGQK